MLWNPLTSFRLHHITRFMGVKVVLPNLAPIELRSATVNKEERRENEEGRDRQQQPKPPICIALTTTSSTLTTLTTAHQSESQGTVLERREKRRGASYCKEEGIRWGVNLCVSKIWKMFYRCLKAVFGSIKIDFPKKFLHLWMFRAAENVGQPKVVFQLTIK